MNFSNFKFSLMMEIIYNISNMEFQIVLTPSYFEFVSSAATKLFPEFSSHSVIVSILCQGILLIFIFRLFFQTFKGQPFFLRSKERLLDILGFFFSFQFLKNIICFRIATLLYITAQILFYMLIQLE